MLSPGARCHFTIRFVDHLSNLLHQGRRIEACVLLRRLAHYDRCPPGLDGIMSVPAWYQQVAAGIANGEWHGAEVEEIVDVTGCEAETIDFGDGHESPDAGSHRGVPEEASMLGAAVAGVEKTGQDDGPKSGLRALLENAPRVKLEPIEGGF